MGVSATPPPAPQQTLRAIKRAMRAANLPVASRLGQCAAYAQIVLAAALASAWLERPELVAVTAVTLGGAIVIGEVAGISPRFENVSGVLVSFAALAVLFVAHAVTDARLLGDEPWLVALVVALVPIGLDWRFAPRLRARVVASGVVVVPLVGAQTSWSLAGAVVWFLAALVTLAFLQRDAEHAVLRPAQTERPAPSERRYAEIARTAAIGLVVGAAAALVLGDLSCTSPTQQAQFGVSDVIGGSANRPLPLPPTDGAEPGDPVDPSSVIVEHDGETVTLHRSDGTSTVYEFDGEQGQIHVTELDEDGTIVDEYSIDGEDVVVQPDGSAVAPSPDADDDAPSRGWIAAIVAAVVALAAAAIGWWWWRHRRVAPDAPNDWAHRMAARLSHEGARRGRARGPGETVATHARALADGPLPDGRVVAVGQMVSAALFGRRAPDASDQAWADAAIDEATTQHPARAVRSRRKK